MLSTVFSDICFLTPLIWVPINTCDFISHAIGLYCWNLNFSCWKRDRTSKPLPLTHQPSWYALPRVYLTINPLDDTEEQIALTNLSKINSSHGNTQIQNLTSLWANFLYLAEDVPVVYNLGASRHNYPSTQLTLCHLPSEAGDPRVMSCFVSTSRWCAFQCGLLSRQRPPSEIGRLKTDVRSHFETIRRDIDFLLVFVPTKTGLVFASSLLCWLLNVFEACIFFPW